MHRIPAGPEPSRENLSVIDSPDRHAAIINNIILDDFFVQDDSMNAEWAIVAIHEFTIDH